MDIKQFWTDVLEQDAEAIRKYFHPDAYVNWHNTNEHFTVNEFLRANCEYPGEWTGQIEQLLAIDDQIVTATQVCTKDRKHSFHVTSFIRVRDNLIISIDEYWGDDGEAPDWRQEMGIGSKIK